MNYTDAVTFAQALAIQSGNIIHKNFIAGASADWKFDGTPVTETDTMVNRLVIEKIAEKYPDHGVLGEEESSYADRDHLWVCDPVDGTLPFAHGLPLSTFSLALTYKGAPVVGVVYDPFFKRLYSAVRGHGALMNGMELSVSRNTMKNAVIDVAGFPSTDPVIKAPAAFTESLIEAGALVTSLWSIILPSALIADQKYTATVFNVTKPHDGAAIKVIVEEAGGTVTDLFGQEQPYNAPIKGFIASNGVVHQQIVELLANYPRV